MKMSARFHPQKSVSSERDPAEKGMGSGLTGLEGADDDRGGSVTHQEAEGDIAGRDEADGERRLGRGARLRGGRVGIRLRGLELAAGGD